MIKKIKNNISVDNKIKNMYTKCKQNENQLSTEKRELV